MLGITIFLIGLAGCLLVATIGAIVTAIEDGNFGMVVLGVCFLIAMLGLGIAFATDFLI